MIQLYSFRIEWGGLQSDLPESEAYWGGERFFTQYLILWYTKISKHTTMLSQYEIRQYVTHWCSVSMKNSLKQKIKSGTVILCGSWIEILSSVIANKRLVSSSCFADFDEVWLTPGSGKFKDAWIFYNNASEIQENDLKRWLKKSREIQWDYKNIVKKRGLLERL